MQSGLWDPSVFGLALRWNSRAGRRKSREPRLQLFRRLFNCTNTIKLQARHGGWPRHVHCTCATPQRSATLHALSVQEGELQEALALYEDNIAAVQAGLEADPDNVELRQVLPPAWRHPWAPLRITPSYDHSRPQLGFKRLQATYSQPCSLLY